MLTSKDSKKGFKRNHFQKIKFLKITKGEFIDPLNLIKTL